MWNGLLPWLFLNYFFCPVVGFVVGTVQFYLYLPIHPPTRKCKCNPHCQLPSALWPLQAMENHDAAEYKELGNQAYQVCT